ncbi:hypothetical protein ETH_00042830, partial [Eimeria tenella]
MLRLRKVMGRRRLLLRARGIAKLFLYLRRQKCQWLARLCAARVLLLQVSAVRSKALRDFAAPLAEALRAAAAAAAAEKEAAAAAAQQAEQQQREETMALRIQ